MTVPPPPHGAPDPSQDPSQASGAPGVPGEGAAPIAAPAPGTDLAADLGAALSFAGRALLRNPASFLVAGLVYSLIILVITTGGVAASIAVMLSRMETSPSGIPGEPSGIDLLVLYAVVLVILLLALPATLLWQSGSARAAETLLEGRRPRIGEAMVGPVRVMLTALLVTAITGVGLLLCYLPGLVAAVLLMFSIPAAARGASPIEAIRESIALVRANIGTSIVSYVVISVISSIASSLIIGVIVAIPFIVLFEMGMYERLNRRELPEPARA